MLNKDPSKQANTDAIDKALTILKKYSGVVIIAWFLGAFLLPSIVRKVLTIVLLIWLGSIVVMDGSVRRRFVSWKFIIPLFFFFGLYVIVSIVSPFSTYNMRKLVLFGAIGVLSTALINDIKISDETILIYLYVFSAAIIVSAIVSIVNPDILIALSVDESSGAVLNPEGEPIFLNAQDRNYAALLVFSYFVISWRRKFWPGIVVSGSYPAVYFGRQYLLMCAIFLGVVFLSSIIASKRHSVLSLSLTGRNCFIACFAAFSLSLPIMLGFSEFWITNMVEPTDELSQNKSSGGLAF
jgi:hypothetical protein